MIEFCEGYFRWKKHVILIHGEQFGTSWTRSQVFLVNNASFNNTNIRLELFESSNI